MVPSGPVVGEKEVMMGGAVMVTPKSVSLSSKPSALVTLIGPEEAPEGTEAVSSEDEMMAKEAGRRAVESDIGGAGEVTA